MGKLKHTNQGLLFKPAPEHQDEKYQAQGKSGSRCVHVCGGAGAGAGGEGEVGWRGGWREGTWE